MEKEDESWRGDKRICLFIKSSEAAVKVLPTGSSSTSSH